VVHKPSLKTFEHFFNLEFLFYEQGKAGNIESHTGSAFKLVVFPALVKGVILSFAVSSGNQPFVPNLHKLAFVLLSVGGVCSHKQKRGNVGNCLSN
jgi:hypothetical protein